MENNFLYIMLENLEEAMPCLEICVKILPCSNALKEQEIHLGFISIDL